MTRISSNFTMIKINTNFIWFNNKIIRIFSLHFLYGGNGKSSNKFINSYFIRFNWIKIISNSWIIS